VVKRDRVGPTDFVLTGSLNHGARNTSSRALEARKSSLVSDMETVKMKFCFLLVLISVALILGGCDGYYTGYPGYGPYYGPAPYYGGGYPGSVTVAVNDRPYYIHGSGYYVARA
jgi:hypothetical protein